jgi:hypothetical protein
MLSLILLDKIKVYVFIIQSALVEEKLKFIISFFKLIRLLQKHLRSNYLFYFQLWRV